MVITSFTGQGRVMLSFAIVVVDETVVMVLVTVVVGVEVVIDVVGSLMRLFVTRR